MYKTLLNNEIFTISTGAGFLPSTVWRRFNESLPKFFRSSIPSRSPECLRFWMYQNGMSNKAGFSTSFSNATLGNFGKIFFNRGWLPQPISEESIFGVVKCGGKICQTFFAPKDFFSQLPFCLTTISPLKWNMISAPSLNEEKIRKPQKFNSQFTPEKWWLKDDPFLLGFGNSSGAIFVKLRGHIITNSQPTKSRTQLGGWAPSY